MLHIAADGERRSRRFFVHVYTVSERAAIARKAGFTEVGVLQRLGRIGAISQRSTRHPRALRSLSVESRGMSLMAG